MSCSLSLAKSLCLGRSVPLVEKLLLGYMDETCLLSCFLNMHICAHKSCCQFLSEKLPFAVGDSWRLIIIRSPANNRLLHA